MPNLVLTRKLQESLRIGQDITVTVIQVKGGKVRLAINAPRDMKVLRSELGEIKEPVNSEVQPAHYSPIDVVVAVELYRQNVSISDRMEALGGGGPGLRAAIEGKLSLLSMNGLVLDRYVANALARYGDEAKKRNQI